MPFSTRANLGSFFYKTAIAFIFSFLALGRSAFALQESGPTFILMIYASGGWDQTMIFDPKTPSPYMDVEAGLSTVKASSGITYANHSNRPAVRTWFEKYGAHAVIVNGIHTPSLDTKKAFGSHFTAIPREKSRPVDFLTYYAASLGPGLLMPHIIFDAPSASGDYTYYTTKITKTRLSEYLSESIPKATSISPYQEESLLSFQKKYWGSTLEKTHQNSLDADKIRSVYGHLSKEKTIRRTFQSISANLGPIGSESSFLRSSKIALDLFASGASLCATVQAGRNYYWDAASQHFSKQSNAFQLLFSDLSAIMTHAEQRGILDRLTIVVTSGNGKSPRLNSNAGKNPWPYTSILLWGAIFRGGTVHGSTDEFLRGVPVDPIFGQVPSENKVVLTMGHIFASIFAASQISFKSLLPDIKPLASIINANHAGTLR